MVRSDRQKLNLLSYSMDAMVGNVWVLPSRYGMRF